MKRSLVILFIVLCPYVLSAQTYELNFDAQVVKSFGVLKKGSSVHIMSMTHDVKFEETSDVKGSRIVKVIDSYILNTDKGDVTVKEKLEKVLDVNFRDAQNFWDVQIIYNVLEQLSKKGTQVDLRAEMEEDALDINKVQSYGLAFDDPYLESYIHVVISKLAPSILIDGRPGSVNLLIQRNPIANASMFPNGTLMITTGLISLLHSEDELAAVLSHEIAHFVLDHSVQNYNKMVSRAKRA